MGKKQVSNLVKTGLNSTISDCWHDAVSFQIEVSLPLTSEGKESGVRHCTYFCSVFYATEAV